MIANIILSHEPAENIKRMMEWWKHCVPVESIVIAYGGSREVFDELDMPGFYVDDPRLKTLDHQRERQSYSGVMRAFLESPCADGVSYVNFAEYDQIPTLRNLNAAQLGNLSEEGADVLGYGVRRVDATSNAHYLSHQSDPGFGGFLQRISCRRDAGVVLSMFGFGSFWTVGAWRAVAEVTETHPIYLELALPTIAHHLGFRVRPVREEVNGACSRFAQPSPVQKHSRVDEAARAGALFCHPVKGFWERSRDAAAVLR